MAEQISSLLRRSVGHLEAQVPGSYRLLLARLGALVVELDVDGQVCTLHGGDRLHITDGPAQAPGTRIATSRAVIVDLLEARAGLGEAVESGAVAVRGALDDVVRAHDTMLAYVHAAVRAPTHPDLLTDLREGR